MAKKPRVQLEISTGFYESASKPLASQQCINYIPVIPQASALNKRALFHTPGLKQFADLVNQPNRGSHELDGIPYFVNGNSLFNIDEFGAITNHGLITPSGRVSMADNGTQLMIVVPGDTAYIFTVADGLEIVTDPNFRLADSVTFQDSLFVLSTSDGKNFFHSNTNDGLTYNALDFGTAVIDSDPIVAVHSSRDEMYVLGSRSIQVFSNIGGAGFVFQEIPGAIIPKGIVGPFAVEEFDGSFVFIGGGLREQASIWKLQGNTAEKISTSAIDQIIQGYTKDELKGSFILTHAQDGNFFASFHFPANTFVYNSTTSALSGSPSWHERKSTISPSDAAWRVTSIVKAHGKLLCGDDRTGLIGELDLKTFTEYGNTVERIVASPPLMTLTRPNKVGNLELVCESGVGNSASPDPKIRMDYSDDGGSTFKAETIRRLGKVGERKTRQIWRRQGRIQHDRVIRFKVTEPVKSTIIRLDADIL